MSDITDPQQWEDGEFDWDAKFYYAVPVSILFGKVRNLFDAAQQLRAELASKGYEPYEEAKLLLEVEMFKGRLLINVPKPDQYDANIVEIEKSKVYSSVHHGEFKKIGETAKKLQGMVQSRKGVKPTATYYWDFRHGPEMAGQRADRFVVFCRV